MRACSVKPFDKDYLLFICSLIDSNYMKCENVKLLTQKNLIPQKLEISQNLDKTKKKLKYEKEEYSETPTEQKAAELSPDTELIEYLLPRKESAYNDELSNFCFDDSLRLFNMNEDEIEDICSDVSNRLNNYNIEMYTTECQDNNMDANYNSLAVNDLDFEGVADVMESISENNVYFRDKPAFDVLDEQPMTNCCSCCQTQNIEIFDSSQKYENLGTNHEILANRFSSESSIDSSE